MPPDALRLAVAIFFAISATNLLTPLLPNIREDLGISFSAAGLVVTSFILARLTVSLIVASVAQRLGRVRTASLGFGLILVGSGIGIAAPGFEALLLSRIVAGAGIGVIATLALAALGDVAPARNRGRVMSLFQIAHNAGIAVYPILGGVIGTTMGWRATFALMALTAVLSATLLLPALRRQPEPEEAASGIPLHAPMHERRRRLTLWTVYVGVFATMFNRHGFRNTLLPLYAGTVLALGPVAIATGVTAMSLVGLVISMPGAMAGDRFGHRRVISAGLIVLALGNLTFLLASDYVTFLLASVTLGFGDFFIGSQTALLATVAGSSDRTRVLGRFRVATDAGALVGPLVLASLIDAFGAQTAMVAAALVLGISGLISRIAIQSDIPGPATGAGVVTE
jgi:predicted MFS family arabinose efflux permease